MFNSDFYFILSIALILSFSFNIVGSYLSLKKQSMMGDALSHALLPGIVLAFLITGTFSGSAFVIGALIAALFSSFLIEFFRSQIRLSEDTSIGITFTALFALGIILLVRFAPNADLDTSCVLYGKLLYAPLKTHAVGFIKIPQTLLSATLVFLFIALSCFLFHKEFMICAFHESMAESMGLSTKLLHYLFQFILALSLVSGLESAGAILILAFLVIPTSFAKLWARSFKELLSYSFLFSAFCVPVALIAAFHWNLNLSSSIVVLEFVIFLLCFALLRTQKKLQRIQV